MGIVSKSHKPAIVGLATLFVLSVILIISSFYLNPAFVVAILSTDGALQPATVQVIKSLQVGLRTIGILGVLTAIILYAVPKLRSLILNSSIIQADWFRVTILAFTIATLIIGTVPTLNAIAEWQRRIRGRSTHELRVEFHPWYSRLYPIWELVDREVPYDARVCISSLQCPEHFFSYYLAPRAIYTCSDNFFTEQKKASNIYYVLSIECKGRGRNKEVVWSLRKSSGRYTELSGSQRGHRQ